MGLCILVAVWEMDQGGDGFEMGLQGRLGAGRGLAGARRGGPYEKIMKV